MWSFPDSHNFLSILSTGILNCLEVHGNVEVIERVILYQLFQPGVFFRPLPVAAISQLFFFLPKNKFLSMLIICIKTNSTHLCVWINVQHVNPFFAEPVRHNSELINNQCKQSVCCSKQHKTTEGPSGQKQKIIVGGYLALINQHIRVGFRDSHLNPLPEASCVPQSLQINTLELRSAVQPHQIALAVHTPPIKMGH